MGRSASVFNKKSRERVARSKKTLGTAVKRITPSVPQAHAIVQANPNAPQNRPPMDRGSAESPIDRVGRFVTNIGRGAEGTVRSYTTDIIDTADSLITGKESALDSRSIQDMTLVDAYVTSAIEGNLDSAFEESRRRLWHEPGRVVGEVATEAATLVGTMGIGAFVKGAKVGAFTSREAIKMGRTANVSKKFGVIGKKEVETRVIMPENTVAITKTTVNKAGDTVRKTKIKKMNIFDKAESLGGKVALWEPKHKFIPSIGKRTRGFYGVSNVAENVKGYNKDQFLSKSTQEYLTASSVVPLKKISNFMVDGVDVFEKPLSENVVDLGSKAQGVGIQSAEGFAEVNPKIINQIKEQRGKVPGLQRANTRALTSGVDITLDDAKAYAGRLAFAIHENTGIPASRVKKLGPGKFEVFNPKKTESKIIEGEKLTASDAALAVARMDESYISSVSYVKPDMLSSLKSIDEDIIVTKNALGIMKSQTTAADIRNLAKTPPVIRQAKEEGITPIELATRKIEVEGFLSDGMTAGGGPSADLTTMMNLNSRAFFDSGQRYGRGLPKEMGDRFYPYQSKYANASDAAIARAENVKRVTKNTRFNDAESNTWARIHDAALEVINPQTGKLYQKKELPESFTRKANSKTNLRKGMSNKEFNDFTWEYNKKKKGEKKTRAVTPTEKEMAVDLIHRLNNREPYNPNYNILDHIANPKGEIKISTVSYKKQNPVGTIANRFYSGVKDTLLSSSVIGKERMYKKFVPDKVKKTYDPLNLTGEKQYKKSKRPDNWRDQQSDKYDLNRESNKEFNKIAQKVWPEINKKKAKFEKLMDVRLKSNIKSGIKETKKERKLSILKENPELEEGTLFRKDVIALIKDKTETELGRKIATPRNKKPDAKIKYPEGDPADIDEAQLNFLGGGVDMMMNESLIPGVQIARKQSGKPLKNKFQNTGESIYDDIPGIIPEPKLSLSEQVRRNVKISKKQRDTSTPFGRDYMSGKGFEANTFFIPPVKADKRGRIGTNMNALMGLLSPEAASTGYMSAQVTRQSKPKVYDKSRNWMDDYLSKGGGGKPSTNITYGPFIKINSGVKRNPMPFQLVQTKGVIKGKTNNQPFGRPFSKTNAPRSSKPGSSFWYNPPKYLIK